MSDSHDGSASPMSPNISARDPVPRPSGSGVDLSVVVEKRIRDMIQILSTCIGDLSKEKQIANKKMETHSTDLKNCLADIETNLNEQINIMEESLMSSDFNCCRALYDHHIETMDDMHKGMRKFIMDAVSRPQEPEEPQAPINNTVDDASLHPRNFPMPVLPMKPQYYGYSNLKVADPTKKIVKNVRFSEKVHKRQFSAAAFEYEYPEEELKREKLILEAALKERISLRSLSRVPKDGANIVELEGYALLLQGDLPKDGDEEGYLEALEPMTDESRQLKTHIESLKVVYHDLRRAYKKAKAKHENRDEGAPTGEAVERLRLETKKNKMILKLALERRNELEGLDEETLAQRREAKLEKKRQEREAELRRRQQARADGLIEVEEIKKETSIESALDFPPGSVDSQATLEDSQLSDSPSPPISDNDDDEEMVDPEEAGLDVAFGETNT